jgi:ABC-type branched-subunit amino acid transport system substrate-binding protein
VAAGLLAGVSLSLTGPLARQGREAAAGLALWAERAAARLVVRDDRGRAADAGANVRALLTVERVELLFGPYGSGLTLAAALVAAEHGAVLWNHGGSADAVAERGGRSVVSLPSPASDYFRELPALARRRDARARRLAVLHARAGGFAAAVAAGAVEAARAAGFDAIHALGFDSPLVAPAPLLAEALALEPDLLVGVGRFEDDVALARACPAAARPRALALVAAGLAAFGREVGAGADGVVGPSQWEPGEDDPPALGPDSRWFSRAFERRSGEPPGYPAAQAFAAGLIAEECARRAGGAAPAPLLAAARDLDTTTLYGGFRLDPATGRQVGHRIRLVRWQAGRRLVVRPSPGVP